MNKAIPKSLRYAVLERDGFACRSCGATNCLEIDHIIPRSKGGPSVESNLQTLCADCNRGKGAMLPAGISALGVPLQELEERWSITRNALKARADMIGVTLIRVSSNCTLWPRDKIALGDALNSHLKNGKPSKAFYVKNSLSQINLRIEEETLASFKELARQRGLSNNKAAQIAIELFLKKYKPVEFQK
jgi:hypothetical protein